MAVQPYVTTFLHPPEPYILRIAGMMWTVLLAFLRFLQNLDFHGELGIRRDDIRYARLAVGEMGPDRDLPVPSDIHSLHRIEDPSNEVLPIDSDMVLEIPVFIGLATLVNLVRETFLRITDNITTAERDPHCHQVILLALDRWTAADFLLKQFYSLSHPHVLRPTVD